jgi:hypothetical protein
MSIGTSAISRMKLRRERHRTCRSYGALHWFRRICYKRSAPNGASLNTAKLMPNTIGSQQAREPQ